ncbi:MAG: glutaminase A [Thermoleophilia bacterium]
MAIADPVAPSITPPFADAIHDLHSRLTELRDGAVADYIPELGRADPELFGIAVATADGAVHASGDTDHSFTIQSISKALIFGMALEHHGLDAVLARVGVEPTGDAFNSIEVDERSGRPFNPMVNAGAIVTTSLVAGEDHNRCRDSLVAYMSRFAGRPLTIDEAVYASERATGDRNRAMAWFMRGLGMLDDVDAALDLYFAQCSVLVTTRDLAVIAATLANGGVNPITGVRALAHEHVERVLAVMATCGMYDFAGEWLYTVGLPAKSGVAGGVIAVLPGQLGIGVFSPRLDPRGNSVRGVRACQELAARHRLHQYRPGLVSTDAVARTYCADVMSSRRSRSADENRALVEHGGRIRVYELRGDLVFGSAERLVRRVLGELGKVGWVLLDFRRVTGIDGTAWELLAGLSARARDHGVRVIASHRERPPVAIETAPTTDEALQRCEDDLLRSELGDRLDAAVPLADQPLLADLPPAALAAIEEVAVPVRLGAGEFVFRAGDEADSIYFVVAGSLSAQVTVPGGARPRRLQGMGPGVAFGELALVDRGPRSADVVVTEDATVYRLGFDDLDALEALHPGLTAALLRGVAQLLSGRLRRVTEQVRLLDA